MQNMPTILDSLRKKMTFLEADFEMAFLYLLKKINQV